MLFGNLEAIKLFSVRETPNVSIYKCISRYSCFILKTYVIRPNITGEYVWVDKNFYSTHQRLNKKHPNKICFDLWLVGITDGIGCFLISYINNKWYLTYKLFEPRYNLRLLYKIKRTLGVGSVVKNNTTAQFIINDRKTLKTTIFPIFAQNPLLTSKSFYYDRFKEAFFILENNNLTQEDKDIKLNLIKEEIRNFEAKLVCVHTRVNLQEGTAVITPCFSKNYQEVKKVITKSWIVGFIEVKGMFYFKEFATAKAPVIFANRFKLITKFDGTILEVLRSIFHIPAKVKYDFYYNYYILNTTNSRCTRNIIKYLHGNLEGMKSLSFRLWSRGHLIVNNIEKISKINSILCRVESKLNNNALLPKKNRVA